MTGWTQNIPERKRRNFKIGDKVKCLIWSYILNRHIWAKGTISGFNPAEWEHPKAIWDIMKNDPNYVYISEGKKYKSFVRYKDYNSMLIHILVNNIYCKHFDNIEHAHYNFQSTVSVDERNGEDGAYDGTSIVHKNEKTPRNRWRKMTKKEEKEYDKEVLPF